MKKMFWRLTLLVMLISLQAGLTAAQSSRPAPSSRSVGDALHSIQWEQLPLRLAIERIEAISQSSIFLDRRVDPNQRVDLVLNHVNAEEIVTQLAAATSLGHAPLERLFYIGPPQTANRIAALAAIRRREVAALPVDLRRTLVDRRRIGWPRLTEPRGLVARLITDHGWHVRREERIPHDLWAAGALPGLRLADQLTVLLAGFDLTYRLLPDERTIEIVPIDWNTLEAYASKSTKRRPQPRPAPAGKKIFTLKIENQPVGRVLDQLGRRLGWQLAIDEAVLSSAGISLDKRVSFAVENADEDQLLEALLTPAGLKAQRENKRVRVTPR